MLFSIININRFYRVILARVSSCSILFNIKVIYFRVFILCGSVAIFIIFKILVNSGAVDNPLNSLYFILLKELVGINNYINIYRGDEFYY